jgi:hypothetical protein
MAIHMPHFGSFASVDSANKEMEFSNLGCRFETTSVAPPDLELTLLHNITFFSPAAEFIHPQMNA